MKFCETHAQKTKQTLLVETLLQVVKVIVKSYLGDIR